MIYRGWISADKTERGFLMDLGVRNLTTYNDSQMCFENVEVDQETLDKLDRHFGSRFVWFLEPVKEGEKP